LSELVHLNGSLVPLAQARVAAMDYGFLYGFGLFETMRAYAGRVFLLDRHLARLAGSADRLGIAVDTAGLECAVADVIRANRLTDARIRLTVSIGEGGPTPDPAGCAQPTVLVVAGQYRPPPEHVYDAGFRAVISSIRRNSRSPLSGMKTLNYLESMLARQEARAAGADEALFLNERGLLAEASMSNLFLVHGGAVKTPALGCGVLPGVAREAVLELAEGMGIAVVEGEIVPEELSGADEAFLTNSLIEVMPLTQVDGKPVGSGKPGPLTQRLRAGYGEVVRRETRP